MVEAEVMVCVLSYTGGIVVMAMSWCRLCVSMI